MKKYIPLVILLGLSLLALIYALAILRCIDMTGYGLKKEVKISQAQKNNLCEAMK